MKPNRLIKEQSLYLLQHSYNPVEWYPWDDEAFEAAIREDMPVFLSIGYSTCHWCHVMERESFEDEEIAALMNQSFINIKVDREERPDIDGIYMAVCQMLTGSGGWPLTIIMTPDKKPFIAGTYFPRDNMGSRIGLRQLIHQISDIWKNKREFILESADNLTKNLSDSIISEGTSSQTGSSVLPPDESIIDKAFDELSFNFDSINGGFGLAPKFPTPHNLTFLLKYWEKNSHDKKDVTRQGLVHEKNDTNALMMVEKTLQKMRESGIYDQLGFGFHRYSTDEHWIVPHFEKMLYDQAMLIIAYTEAYQVTGKEEYKQTAEEIIEYVTRDMTDSSAGFYCAEDADSEGEEGKFYIWQKSEIESALGDDAELFCKVFNVFENGNYKDNFTENSRNNILHLIGNTDEISFAKDIGYLKKIGCLKKLYNLREKRVKPLKDDKILTDWNGLMIAALSIAGRTFGNDMYIKHAIKSSEFIFKHLQKEDTLLHRYRSGEASINGMLDDYVFLIWGLIELYESCFDVKYLKESIGLCTKMTELFWDDEYGGYYFSTVKSNDLIVRKKEIYDGAVPSGNSIALTILLKLWKLTGNNIYSEYAQKLIKSFSNRIPKMPSAYAQFLSGLMYWLSPSSEIVIVVPKEQKHLIFEKYLMSKENFEPFSVILMKEDGNSDLDEIAPYTKEMKMLNDKPTYYVCRDFKCELPTNENGKILNY